MSKQIYGAMGIISTVNQLWNNKKVLWTNNEENLRTVIYELIKLLNQQTNEQWVILFQIDPIHVL